MTWIKLHRQLQESQIWNRDPANSASAWIDLLLLASHNERKTIIQNHGANLHRGDFIVSVRFLMKRWKWGNAKTQGYIKLLIDLGMISKISTFIGRGPGTIYHITNYDTYQGRDDDNQYASQYASSTRAVRNQEGIRRDKNKSHDRLFPETGSEVNEDNNNLSLAANAEKRVSQPDAAFEFFSNYFNKHLDIPYVAKVGDFVQLNKLRKRLGIKGKASCPEGWDHAVENYFASNLADWTLADLSVRFHLFRKNSLDRFGRRGEASIEDQLERLRRK